MDTQRLILAAIFVFSLVLLWDAWEKENRPKPPAAPAVPAAPARPAPAKPDASAASGRGTAAGSAVPGGPEQLKGEIVQITTDVLSVEIDTVGATLRRLELLKHKDGNDANRNFALLDPERAYAAQSGLTGEAGPNHRTLWKLDSGERALASGKDALEVRFSAQGRDGLSVAKIYSFRRDSYLVEVAFEIRNSGAVPVSPFAYFQLTHDGKAAEGGNTLAQSFGAQSFLGFAEFTNEKKFEKIHFSDLDKGKAEHAKHASDGWLAFVQHYFVSAWIAPDNTPRDYVAEKRADGVYVGRIVLPLPVLTPGASARIGAALYAGPQEQRRLKAAAPGLDLAVDYGWLAIIAWPLFWLLEKCYSLSGNWGVAIILLTVVVKLLFFPLSAASYKSMAKMKLITPRLTKIR